MFILFKLLILISVLFLSLVLFSLKIIGGSDGKLILFIFTIHPLIFLNFRMVFSFFLLFSLCIIVLFIVNFIYNNFNKDSYSFVLIIGPGLEISILRKLYIKTFYKFFNYSELNKYVEKKYLIKSLDLIYNVKSNKFQILCQIRPPLILLIVLSYYIIFHGKLLS